jgi:hypothetical protein
LRDLNGPLTTTTTTRKKLNAHTERKRETEHTVIILVNFF